MHNYFEDAGYSRIDLSEISNPNLSEIGDFILQRKKEGFKGEFKSIDILILRNHFFPEEHADYCKDAHKRFFSLPDYELFLKYAKPFDKLLFPKINPCYIPVLGSMFNFDLFLNLDEYNILNDTIKYLDILNEFKFGNDALIEAGIKK